MSLDLLVDKITLGLFNHYVSTLWTYTELNRIYSQQCKKCTNVLHVIWLTLVTAFVRFALIPVMRGVMCPYMQTEEILMVLEEVFVIVGLKAQRAKEFARNLKVCKAFTTAILI